MSTLDRIVGWVSLPFLVVIYIIGMFAGIMVANTLYSGLITLVFLLGLIASVWTAVNAYRYRSHGTELTMTDKILLAGGVANTVLLLVGIVSFVYIGEN